MTGSTLDPRARRALWTVPNAICFGRILGLAPLLWAAHGDRRQAFFWILAALLASDWIDGKMALLLDQETSFGARLDSAADGLMYLAIALSFWWLEADAIREHTVLFAAGFLAVTLTWCLSALVGLIRFRRLPSYHTWGAKASWLATGAAAVIWLLTGDPAPVPWVLGLVALVNLEAVAIGALLPRWRVDVPTALHAWRVRRRDRRDG